jgi:tetratricopeptide (TPR) repeat protein
MSSSESQVPPDADEEVTEGRAELASGDLDEALMRAARAVAVAPERSDVVAFADEAIRAHPRALHALRASDGTAYGIVALRARALAAEAKWSDAIALAMQVATFRPSLAYAAWGLPWLERAKPLSRAQADELLSRAVAFAQRVLGAASSDDALPNLHAVCAVLDAVAPKAGDRTKAMVVHSMLLRHAGRADEAVSVAAEAYRSRPDWMSAAELANAYRDAGRLKEAGALYQRASDYDPADLTARLDLANVQLRMEDWDGAEATYRRVLRSAPGDQIAHASLTYLLARRGDGDAQARLRAMANMPGEVGDWARRLLARAAEH